MSSLHYHLPPPHQGRRPHAGPLPPMAPPVALRASSRAPPPGVPVRTSSRVPPSAVPQIISQHPGPARRFYFHCPGADDLCAQAESWLHSPALANLEELDISYSYANPQLPPSALRSASTLLVAKMSHCGFPDEIVPSMNFPLLKQLSLMDVSISEDVFHDLLSGCHALESLYVSELRGVRCLRISSSTIRSISFSDSSIQKGELVIEDAPLLGISPVSSANSMRTVKIFALRSSGHELDAVLNILRWFPCLEKLYVIFHKHNEENKKNGPQYDPLHPIECLQTHLKRVVLRSFVGNEKQYDFARFFVLNAKVLNKVEFEGFSDYNSVSVAYLHSLLQVENRASQDAQFEFRRYNNTENQLEEHIHDLSVADPFSSHRQD